MNHQMKKCLIEGPPQDFVTDATASHLFRVFTQLSQHKLQSSNVGVVKPLSRAFVLVDFKLKNKRKKEGCQSFVKCCYLEW